jgi:hypothetical protein
MVLMLYFPRFSFFLVTCSSPLRPQSTLHEGFTVDANEAIFVQLFPPFISKASKQRTLISTFPCCISYVSVCYIVYVMCCCKIYFKHHKYYLQPQEFPRLLISLCLYILRNRFHMYRNKSIPFIFFQPGSHTKYFCDSGSMVKSTRYSSYR